MKKIKALIFVSSFAFLIGCSKKTSNKSRQFEKRLKISALTSSEEEINLSLRSWYQFTTKSDKTFDDKGQWVDKGENGDFLVEGIIRSSLRSIIGKYTAKELYAIEKRTFEEEIYKTTRSRITTSDSKDGLKIQFNNFLLDEMQFPDLVNQAKSKNLLVELELLKSPESDFRLKGIKKLLQDGTETSYLIILNHWAKEKNERIRSYILKSLVNKKSA